VRRVVVILFVVACFSGCGSKRSGPLPSATNVETRAATPNTPEGFSVRAVPAQGFAIAVPKEWSSIDASTALRGGGVKRFERENPAAAGAVEALARPNSPMKFVAVGPARGGFATNVNVLVSRIPAEVSFKRWTTARLQIRGTPRDLAIHQYMVKRGSRLYVLTFTTEATTESRFAQTFEQSARTFTLTT
jgi:hypothetical protein